MSLIREILKHEVYPAVGCTEPVSCAYAAALAAERLGEPVRSLDLRADMGTFKNGAAVTVPHSGGGKGNLVAAAMGAALGRAAARLELLRDVTPEVLDRALGLVRGGACTYACLEGVREFRVEASVRGDARSARCVLAGGHTDIELIEKDGEAVFRRGFGKAEGAGAGYREALKRLSLAELIEAASRLDGGDLEELRHGIDVNLAIAERGAEVQGAGAQLRQLREQGILGDDLFYRVKVRVASAVDARMAGLPLPAMTSGGSGNQGIVAILTPALAGRERGVPEEKILRSVAVAHAVNAYIKGYLGELSVICGCAVAAGIAASVAIVTQHAGADLRKIRFAVNNVVGDLTGLICDGAKPGCAMKTVSSVDAAMRAAFMAAGGFGLSDDDGMIGRTAEESIRNLGRIGLEGMFRVDPTVVDILTRKAASSGRA